MHLHPKRQRRAQNCGRGLSLGEGCRYLLTFDNHNSVNGIREYARAKGASVTYVPVILPTCASTRLNC